MTLSALRGESESIPLKLFLAPSWKTRGVMTMKVLEVSTAMEELSLRNLASASDREMIKLVPTSSVDPPVNS